MADNTEEVGRGGGRGGKGEDGRRGNDGRRVRRSKWTLKGGLYFLHLTTSFFYFCPPPTPRWNRRLNEKEKDSDNAMMTITTMITKEKVEVEQKAD